MKRCPNCNGKYDDRIKKCPACNASLTDYQGEPIVEPNTVRETGFGRISEISPHSLKGLNFCSKVFKFFLVFILVIGAISVVACFSMNQPLVAVAVLAAVLTMALSYYMVSVLFKVLTDIIIGIYHIADNVGQKDE